MCLNHYEARDSQAVEMVIDKTAVIQISTMNASYSISLANTYSLKNKPKNMVSIYWSELSFYIWEKNSLFPAVYSGKIPFFWKYGMH